MGQRLGGIEARVEGGGAVVPAPAIVVFDEMAEAHEGEAMAQVEVIDRIPRIRLEHVQLHVPFEQVRCWLREANHSPVVTACSRILFMQEEVRGLMVKK